MYLTKRLCFLICICLTLVNCAYLKKPNFIQNRDTHYLTATSIPPLRIPPGISSDTFESYYPVPDRDYSHVPKNVSLLPPGLE